MQDKLYDITPIPVFPWVPGVAVWLALLLVFFVAIALYWLFPRIHRSFSRQRRAFSLVEREFEKALNSSGKISNTDLSRLSLLARRYLACSLDQAILSFTGDEILSLQEQSAEPLRSLLAALSALEDLRYQNQTDAAIPARLKPLLSSLRQYEAARKERKR